jgi:hypothetical protein
VVSGGEIVLRGRGEWGRGDIEKYFIIEIGS